MENKLYDEFKNKITSQWPSKQITEEYNPLNHRELYELAYHTCNTISSRCIHHRVHGNTILFKK